MALEIENRLAPIEAIQNKEQIALLLLNGVSVEKIIAISTLGEKHTREVIKKVRKEIEVLSVEELKALFVSKVRLSLANHTLMSKTLLLEFFDVEEQLLSLRSQSSPPTSSSTTAKTMAEKQIAIDRRVDRLLLIGEKIAKNDKNVSDIIKAMGGSRTDPPTPLKTPTQGPTKLKSGVLVDVGDIKSIKELKQVIKASSERLLKYANSKTMDEVFSESEVIDKK